MRRFGIFATILVLVTGAAYGQASLDGVYKSPPGGVSGNSACSTTRFGYPLRVAAGVARMQTVTAGELQGPVSGDGSINITQGNVTLVGKIAGSHFSGRLGFGRCSFDLNYDK